VVAKAIAALALTAGAGGVALAATTTSLPDDLPQATASHTTDPTTAPETKAAAADGTDPASGARPTDTNSTGLIGLCRAWAAGAMDHGKAADNPAFSRLAVAAGGDTAISGFCATVRADHPTPGQPTTTPPGKPDAPTDPADDPAAPATPAGSPPSKAPAKPDRPADSTPGKPDRRSGSADDADQADKKHDTASDHPTGPPDGAPTQAKKAAAHS